MEKRRGFNVQDNNHYNPASWGRPWNQRLPTHYPKCYNCVQDNYPSSPFTEEKLMLWVFNMKATANNKCQSQNASPGLMDSMSVSFSLQCAETIVT